MEGLKEYFGLFVVLCEINGKVFLTFEGNMVIVFIKVIEGVVVVLWEGLSDEAMNGLDGGGFFAVKHSDLFIEYDFDQHNMIIKYEELTL